MHRWRSAEASRLPHIQRFETVLQLRTTNDCSSKASLAEFISLWNVSYVKGPLTRVSVTRVHWSPNQKHKRVSDRQAHYSVLKVRCIFLPTNKNAGPNIRPASSQAPGPFEFRCR